MIDYVRKNGNYKKIGINARSILICDCDKFCGAGKYCTACGGRRKPYENSESTPHPFTSYGCTNMDCEKYYHEKPKNEKYCGNCGQILTKFKTG